MQREGAVPDSFVKKKNDTRIASLRSSPTGDNALQHATPEGFETAGNPVA
jgi:hypothetical protein